MTADVEVRKVIVPIESPKIRIFDVCFHVGAESAMARIRDALEALMV